MSVIIPLPETVSKGMSDNMITKKLADGQGLFISGNNSLLEYRLKVDILSPNNRIVMLCCCNDNQVDESMMFINDHSPARNRYLSPLEILEARRYLDR